MNGKKLYKSRDNRMISGVCAGIAEYFNMDPTIIRLAWVLFSLLGGSGVLGYIIAALVMPEDPNRQFKEDQKRSGVPLRGAASA